MAALDRGADDAESRAIAARGERPGVAMGQHPAGLGHQRSAVAAHGAASGDVFFIHAEGFLDDRGLDGFDGHSSFAGQRGEAAAHALDGPKEIHGGRTRGGERAADRGEAVRKRRHRLGGAVLHPQGKSHSRGNADCRSPAHHHVEDGLGNLVISGCQHIGFFEGQAGLVEEAYALGGPLKGGNHNISSLEPAGP